MQGGSAFGTIVRLTWSGQHKVKGCAKTTLVVSLTSLECIGLAIQIELHQK
jgi:hypothetical protein